MLGWLSKKEYIQIEVDIHSHLLPGIDDGVKDFTESISIIRTFSALGFKKLVTTPHIYQEYYPNTRESILSVKSELDNLLAKEDLEIKIEAAAEYFMDDHLMKLLDTNDPLLSFGSNNYVLVETAFFTKPIIFDELIFKLKTKHYTPVLAHPERYQYLEDDLSWLKRIKSNGVKLQVSLPSLIGAYGPEVKVVARNIMKEGLVDFYASDIHRLPQFQAIKEALRRKYIPQNLLNNELI